MVAPTHAGVKLALTCISPPKMGMPFALALSASPRRQESFEYGVAHGANPQIRRSSITKHQRHRSRPFLELKKDLRNYVGKYKKNASSKEDRLAKLPGKRRGTRRKALTSQQAGECGITAPLSKFYQINTPFRECNPIQPTTNALKTYAQRMRTMVQPPPTFHVINSKTRRSFVNAFPQSSAGNSPRIQRVVEFLMHIK